MPAKRTKKAASKPPLEGCRVALSGTFPGFSHSALQKQVTDLGGSTSSSVTKDTTHLVTIQSDYDKPSAKVKAAKEQDIHIVALEWLQDCATADSKVDEAKYLLNSSSSSAAATAPSGSQASQPNGSPSAPQTKPSRSRKRAASPAPAAPTSDLGPKAKKKKDAATISDTGDNALNDTSNGSADGVVDEAAAEDAKPTKSKRAVGEGQVAKSSDLQIPLDEGCPLVTYKVYIDDKGVIYDASLNQTNASNNNNKFYRIQLLHDGLGTYKTWTRWGRVGERGQDALLGGGSLAEATSTFEKKFKDKSGLSWAQRGDAPKPKKYAFVERSYEPDSDNEDEDVKNGEPAPAKAPVLCTLHPAVKGLMELIFNQAFFAAAMSDLNYDANKLPLGKLSKATITRGFQTLKDLSALLDDASLAAGYGVPLPQAIEQLSNTYYSLIPHDFRRNRPPVINTQPMIKKELELLESLSDMKDAAKIMKGGKDGDDEIHPIDKQFQGLGMDEMTPLDRTTDEFRHLSEYLMNTRGSTHRANYNIDAIFRVERGGERGRFETSSFAGLPRGDRRLLWHGSRCTNFGGILSQGLRIAPPEAPVSGYMFGKGIYLADMSSKSANYCCSYLSNNTALLLLCEAELGDPMQTLTAAKYDAGDTAQANGQIATWGQGATGPLQWKDAECVHASLKGVKMPDTTVAPGNTGVPGAHLLYNEYICYDVAQVRLRYLFRVKM